MRARTVALARGRGVHLGELTAALADRYGDRVALHDPAPTPGLDHGETRTFRELEDGVGRLAAVHRDRGVLPGQRVLVAVDDRVDVALHAFALARLGAVPVPVNHRLSARELAAVATATDAVAAVADADVLGRLPSGLDVACTTERDGDGGASIAAALAHAVAVPAPDDLDADAPAILLTTSGTTGFPKAASLTSRGLLSTLGRLAAVPLGADLGPLRRDRDRIFACLPLTHVMGFSVLLAALAGGIPLVRRTRFDAAEALDLVESTRPNIVVAVPTMYADLERAGAADRDLSSVQLYVSSADTLPADRARRLQRYGAAVRIGPFHAGTAVVADVFGMVELSGPAAVRIYPPSPVGDLPAPSFALTLPGVSVRAVDEDGEPVPRGTVGELQWRGPNVLRRYEGHDADGPDADGWFGSGDQGRLLGGRLFRFAGRSRDRLKVGGFSVFPAEVEESLGDAPGVAELAVVGVDDERLGERLVAVTVPDGPAFDDEAFLTWARGQVAGYRRPTEVVVVDSLPRGANGKLDRSGATALAVARSEGTEAT